MRISARMIMMGAVSLAGLLMGYAFIFSFYATGLFGDGSQVSAAVWEKALYRTIVLGPFVAAFLLLGFLAWRERWASGVLPWVAGATGVLVLARWDAGILSAVDLVWIVPLLLAAAAAGMGRHEDDEGGKR